MSTRTCHHVLASGALCQATPLRNRDYCRFHLQQIGRRMKAARSRARHEAPLLKLPLLEDLYSVQIALMQLGDAIAYREIDPQYARLLTTVLRLAMQNLKSKQGWEHSLRFQAAGDTEGHPTTWDTFEQEHDLPEDFDLSLDPEVAFPATKDDSTGAPYIPEVGMYGNDDPLRAKVGQILRDAETATPCLATADDVEIMDVYEREGNDAMMKCVVEQQRNRTRRERRARRLHYEEVARNHNVQRAARKMVEDQQKLDQQTKREQRDAAGAQTQSTSDAQMMHSTSQPTDESSRKPPQSETPPQARKDVAGEA